MASEKTQRRDLGQGPLRAMERGEQGWGEGISAEEEEVSPLDTLILRCSWILALACPVPFAISRRNLHVYFGKWGCSLDPEQGLGGLTADLLRRRETSTELHTPLLYTQV